MGDDDETAQVETARLYIVRIIIERSQNIDDIFIDSYLIRLK